MQLIDRRVPHFSPHLREVGFHKCIPNGMLTEEVARVGRTLLSAAFDFAFDCVARAPPPAKGFVSGHDFSRAIQIEHAFTGWLKAIP
jgi:hypothetical protein